jgi:hypothetical protein
MAWLIPLLEGVVNVMETVTFIQFIEEEAIQSAALGAFLAIRSKSYAGAALAIDLLENQLIPNLRAINDYVGWIAPYSKGCFADFITSQETNLEIYKDILYAKKK